MEWLSVQLANNFIVQYTLGTIRFAPVLTNIYAKIFTQIYLRNKLMFDSFLCLSVNYWIIHTCKQLFTPLLCVGWSLDSLYKLATYSIQDCIKKNIYI